METGPAAFFYATKGLLYQKWGNLKEHNLFLENSVPLLREMKTDKFFKEIKRNMQMERQNLVA